MRAAPQFLFDLRSNAPDARVATVGTLESSEPNHVFVRLNCEALVDPAPLRSLLGVWAHGVRTLTAAWRSDEPRDAARDKGATLAAGRALDRLLRDARATLFEGARTFAASKRVWRKLVELERGFSEALGPELKGEPGRSKPRTIGRLAYLLMIGTVEVIAEAKAHSPENVEALESVMSLVRRGAFVMVSGQATRRKQRPARGGR